MANETYIDFGVAPYALPVVCEALYKNGITNAFLTLDDGNIHVRWKYDINRGTLHRSLTDGVSECNNGTNI